MWLVGQYRSGMSGDVVWDFQGIFSTKKKAMKAMRNDKYFIHEVTLNEELPDETIIMDMEYKEEV